LQTKRLLPTSQLDFFSLIRYTKYLNPNPCA
jgi:hypothetical protein